MLILIVMNALRSITLKIQTKGRVIKTNNIETIVYRAKDNSRLVAVQ